MIRILLADDEEAITSELAPFLERTGLYVAVARSGDEAMTMIGQLAPDLVILDVLMPGLNGREVCRRLRAAGNWTPVIMLTQVGTSGERFPITPENIEKSRQGYKHIPMASGAVYLVFLERLQGFTKQYFVGVAHPWRFKLPAKGLAEPESPWEGARGVFPPIPPDQLLRQVEEKVTARLSLKTDRE